MPRSNYDIFNSYMRYTENSEPPVLFRKWAALSLLANCIRRRCWLDMGFQTLYPNMYTVLVGPPAVRKSTALRQMESILNYVKDNNNAICIASDSITPEAFYTRLGKLSEDPVPSLHPDTHCKFDSTIDVVSDELSSFLRSKKGNYSFLTNLCTFYDGRDYWVDDTKTAGVWEGRGVSVNITAATTSDSIKECFPDATIGGGFSRRIVFVFGKEKAASIPFPVMTDEEQQLKTRLQADCLYLSKKVTGPFQMTNEWKQLYQDFYESVHDVGLELQTKKLENYVNSRHIHLIKMSMLFSLSRGTDLTITDEDFVRSYDLLMETEKLMHCAFVGFGRNPLENYVNPLIDFLKGFRRHQWIPLSIVYSRFSDDLSLIEFNSLADELEAQKAIERDMGDFDGRKEQVMRIVHKSPDISIEPVDDPSAESPPAVASI